MKLSTTLIVLFGATTLASPVKDGLTSENEVFTFEKRRSCSGERHNYEVCQGNFLAQMNSVHNCYRRGGRCCARNKTRDYGKTVSNAAQNGEDCGYCYSGTCKVEKH